MNEKDKEDCRVLNYFEHYLVFVSVVSGCVSISAFVSLVVFLQVFASYAIGLKTCSINTGTKKYKSIIKKKRKKHDKIALLGDAKLDTIKVLISKALIDAQFSHDEFFSVNNVLREYDEMKEEIKNPKIKIAINLKYN